jgi:hypothetical protein
LPGVNLAERLFHPARTRRRYRLPVVPGKSMTRLCGRRYSTGFHPGLEDRQVRFDAGTAATKSIPPYMVAWLVAALTLMLLNVAVAPVLP